ncbi:sel1 repeat family protein [Taylorella equigenitalis]|uniref:tetratricopeptide repeat protein n=1 Tax=Taylorella equigenitalis TaxID=29575 RepID=UPI00041F9101|nr:tetratricopeptide repeat protein [Taylorella equigenitalis]WDU48442.1 sel1 repeat family protein [Taylorella equigenitalis]
MRRLSAILTLILSNFMICGSISAQIKFQIAPQPAPQPAPQQQPQSQPESKSEEYEKDSSGNRIKKMNADFINGLNLYFGFNTPQDFVKAREIMEPYAQMDNTTAQMFVGDMYVSGLGVKKDMQKGLDLLLISAKRFNKLSAKKYSDILVYGVDIKPLKTRSPSGIVEDAQKEFINSGFPKGYSIDQTTKEELPHSFLNERVFVFNYLKEISDGGNALAQNYLGDMYFYGVAVNKDQTMAYKLYEDSAAQGNPNGMMNQAHLLMCGYGVSEDRTKAINLMKDVAQKYNVSYIYRQLGNIYLYGEGVNQNYEEAKAWFKKAGDLGDEVATRDVYLIENIDSPKVQSQLKISKQWRGHEAACDPKYPLIIK